MSTAIVFFSQHHQNTRRLVEAIAALADVTLINAAEVKSADLTAFDRVGFASGIYFASFAKQVLSLAESSLPEGKDVFFLATCGVQSGVYFDAIRKVATSKGCRELGSYLCLGFDTFGPFKLVGGIAKGHPDDEEIAAAVRFYQAL